MVKKTFLALLLFNSKAYSESREVIALVDTGYSKDPRLAPYYCKGDHYDVTGTSIYDNHGHGTMMASLIANSIDSNKTCIRSIKWFDIQNDNLTSYRFMQNIVNKYSKLLLEIKPNYINMSLSGNTFFYQEFKAIKKLAEQNTYIVIAAGNDGIDLDKLCYAYPACYTIKSDKIRVVMGMHGNRRALTSNYNGPAKYKEQSIDQCAFDRCSSGTSAATAIYTGKLASGKVK